MSRLILRGCRDKPQRASLQAAAQAKEEGSRDRPPPWTLIAPRASQTLIKPSPAKRAVIRFQVFRWPWGSRGQDYQI